MAGLLVGVALAQSLTLDPTLGESPTAWSRPSGIDWLIWVTPALAVAFRRSHTGLALVGGSLATMVVWANALPNTMASASVLLYSATVHLRVPVGRRAALAAAGVLVVFTGIGVAANEVPVWVLPLVVVSGIVPVVVGEHLRTRDAYITEVERRAEDAEARRAADERAIVERERNRIARDLHDVVAHGLSVIVVQAGAAQRVLDEDPGAARTSLSHIEHTSRESLIEMRRVLGILRSGADDMRRPTPGLVALDELAQDFEASGLTVRLAIDDRLAEREMGSATLDTTAFRIVQESLTNALKHGGPGSEATVRLSLIDDQLEISIIDDGRLPDGYTPNGSGQGLRGMRERVELFGGSLRTGPRFAGGFEVRALLPLDSVVA